jgi:nucleoside 2-deoxyribosyltransferase
MLLLANYLRDAGFEPFVPHADGMEFSLIKPDLIGRGVDEHTAGEVLHRAIFALDVYQVMAGCGSLVLNMNGRVPDEGAVSEAAMAWTLGKPVVIFKEDVRSKIAGRDNPLVVGLTDFKVVQRMEFVGIALNQRLAELQVDPLHEVACPKHLKKTLAAGERLWKLLEELGDERPAEPVATAVWELFGATAQAD